MPRPGWRACSPFVLAPLLALGCAPSVPDGTADRAEVCRLAGSLPAQDAEAVRQFYVELAVMVRASAALLQEC